MNDFAARLLAWFDVHGRHDLPWQRPGDPYAVWVSEIMLQQTQVATVIPYYQRFMARFPDLASLAAASEDEVLAHWSGLGYYARARNLHRAARQAVAEHGGRLPEDIDTLQTLPGIGRSTAGAILSLALGQRHAILDGNVKRVLARHHAIPGWPGQAAVARTLWSLAEALTPDERVAEYNQAMMDLGATLCTRSRPACERCPLAADCAARRQGRQADFPGRKPRRPLPERRVQMLLVRDPEGRVLLERRPAEGVWGGLWSLPELPADADPLAWCRGQGYHPIGTARALPSRRHTFSHFHLEILPREIRLEKAGCGVADGDRLRWYHSRELAALGLAAPVARLLREIEQPETGETPWVESSTA